MLPRSRSAWTGRGGGLCTLAALLSVLAWAPAARAGGLYVNEFSTTVQANAGAGRGAWAPDASVALHNPAATAELEDHGFATGFSLAFGQVEFDASSSSPSGTGSGGNQAGLAPLASLNYVHRVSDRLRFGLSVFSLSGSILDPGNDWAGRFELTEISLLTLSFAPSLGVRVTDWLSIGGGPVITYGVLDWSLRVSFPVGDESNLRLDSLDDWQVAGRVGILLTPLEGLKLAVYYQSETDFELSGDGDGPIGLDPDIDTELPLPQFVEVSAAWAPTEALTLLFLFNWEDWSAGEDLNVTVGAVDIDATTGFQDTYKFGIGANYRANEAWLLQTGLTVDTSALRNKDRTTALPVDRQIRFGLGFQYAWSETLHLGGSFLYADLGQGEVRKPTVRGDYDDNHLFVFGVTLSFGRLPWAGKASLPESWGI